jgi:hypothetical protein
VGSDAKALSSVRRSEAIGSPSSSGKAVVAAVVVFVSVAVAVVVTKLTPP